MLSFFAKFPVLRFHFFPVAIAREIDGKIRDDFPYQSRFRLGRGALLGYRRSVEDGGGL